MAQSTIQTAVSILSFHQQQGNHCSSFVSNTTIQPIHSFGRQRYSGDYEWKQQRAEQVEKLKSLQVPVEDGKAEEVDGDTHDEEEFGPLRLKEEVRRSDAHQAIERALAVVVQELDLSYKYRRNFQRCQNLVESQAIHSFPIQIQPPYHNEH